jgi:hypothetical protein
MASRAHHSRGPRCRRIQAARCCSRPECAQDQHGPRRPVGSADGLPRPAPSVRPVRPGRSFLPTGCGSANERAACCLPTGRPLPSLPPRHGADRWCRSSRSASSQSSPPSPCARRAIEKGANPTLGDLPMSVGAPEITVPRRAIDGELAPTAEVRCPVCRRPHRTMSSRSPCQPQWPTCRSPPCPR